MYDSVVIGAGIAGTTLALYLRKSGRKVLLIGDKAESSSHVAAGIVNPITGRKFVLSWNFPELIEEAKSFFQSHTFPNHFKNIPVYRALKQVGDYNEWDAKSTQPTIVEYGKSIGDHDFFSNIWADEVQDWLKISHGGRLDIPSFLKDAHKELQRDNAFLERRIHVSDLLVQDRRIYLRDIDAGEIFLAEGVGPQNGLLGSTPLRPAKGEVLLLKAEDLPENLILKNQFFLVHLQEDTYWFGSNYQRSSNALPTKKTYNEMISFLKKNACFPYKIIAHRTGLRPTIPDRRPVVGRLPNSINCYIFNGMGSKGSSLSPWCARQLVDFLDKGMELDREIDSMRYADRWAI